MMKSFIENYIIHNFHNIHLNSNNIYIGGLLKYRYIPAETKIFAQ
jgi:hypothetical protein